MPRLFACTYAILSISSFSLPSDAAIWPFNGKQKCEDALRAKGLIQEELNRFTAAAAAAAAATSKVLAPELVGAGAGSAAPAVAPAPVTTAAANIPVQNRKDTSVAEINELLNRQSKDVRDAIFEKFTGISDAPIRPAFAEVNTLIEASKAMFKERENLLDLFLRILIGHGTLLMTGLPGSAKSAVADQIGQSLVDPQGKTSSFSLQMTPDTTQSELMGGLITSEILEGHSVRAFESGLLGHYYVFLDEFFDTRVKFIRNLLVAMNERIYKAGKSVYQGKTRVFVTATNRYLNEVYELFSEIKPRAVVDRFTYIYHAPGILTKTSSLMELIHGERAASLPKLEFARIDELHDFAEKVPLARTESIRARALLNEVRRKLGQIEFEKATEHQDLERRSDARAQIPPFKATRVFSERTFLRIARLVRVEALVRAGGLSREQVLRVEPLDVDNTLRRFLILQSEHIGDLPTLKAAATHDPTELAQLEAIAIENAAIDEACRELAQAEAAINRPLGIFRAGPKTAAEALKILKQLSQRVGSIEDSEQLSFEKVVALRAMREVVNQPWVRRFIK